ncbi:MAG: C25 family cysteine peptidase, partial [candidate division WOR-3 bacterium]
MQKLALLCLGICIPVLFFGGIIQHTFHFSADDLSLVEYNGYDVVRIKEGVSNTEVGKPSIPFIVANFIIPPTAEVKGVEVLSTKVQEIPGRYNICPVQKPRPISGKEDVPFVEPNTEIYNSSIPYPEKDIVFFPSGSMSGYRIAGIFLNPIKYIPAEKKLILTTEITIVIHYEENRYEPISLTEKQKSVFSQGVRAIVVNPEDIDRFAPPTKPDPQRACNYAIITNSTLQAAWQRLANWKIAAGYQAQVFTTDWIYANYTGYDNQEKIRNFLKDYFTNQGLIFAVLGGDNNIVPERDAYCDYYSPYNLASDYYYSDLDGTWDANNNHQYGEATGDGVDGYFDIYVGRPPVDDATEINNFLNKDSTYIYNPPSSYIQKILLPSVMLFSQYNYHGRVVNDAIGNKFPSWTVTKLEDQIAPATRNAFNQNYNLMHIAAHGDQNGTYTQSGSPVFTTSDISYLTNTMPTIMNSIACYSGDFDEYNDCFAEALVTDDQGCVATIMNSRYGWGSPPSMGPSEQMDTCFYSVLLKDTFYIGVLHGASKNHYRNLIWNNAAAEPWHYCGLELNLFGDPEMRVRISPANQPYIYIANRTLNDQNNNGIWDPGEYAELVTTLSNSGSVNATNVNAVLRATTNSQYVTISDSTSFFGNISAGGSANNNSDPYKMTAASNTPNGTEIGFTLHITADGGYSWDHNFTLVVGSPGYDYVTHDCGNCQFTVTRYGALGFMSSGQTGGVGFKYPGTGSNHLFYGGFAVGNSSSYVVDRYYESASGDDQDWNTTASPDGKCRMLEPGPWGFDEYATARYDDSGHPSAKGLLCEQYSWAWDDATANDFVTMKFVLRNQGSTTISNLYAAVFMDWDISSSYTSNNGNSEAARNLTYMYYNTSYPYVGVEILDPPRTVPAKNLA